MKKILALVLSLMMLCCCAYAEEEVNSYVFDPALVEGLEGEYAAIAELGVQMWLPANVVSLEPSEADVARGVIAVLAAEDGSLAVSITLAGVADADGNLITDLYGLAEFYAASGVTEMEIALFNELPALYYVLESNGVAYGNLAMMTSEGYVVAISALSNGEEVNAELATVILTSVMPYVAE